MQDFWTKITYTFFLVSGQCAEAVEATVEASKPTTSTTGVKKRARFDLDPTTTPAENENLLPPTQPAATSTESAANGSGNVKIKKSVHILSATTSTLTSTGRVSDPCEVTILDRPHAYGACAQNGGHPKPPRTCRSVGVSTKDDQPVINNSISTQCSNRNNRGCVPPSNGTSDTSSSVSSATQGKDLFDRSHNTSHSTLYPDVLKIKTIIVEKQNFCKKIF